MLARAILPHLETELEVPVYFSDVCFLGARKNVTYLVRLKRAALRN